MPSPTLRTVHTDAILNNFSIAYMGRNQQFIAGRVFPQLLVDKKSDLYYVYNKNDWFVDRAKPRAGGTESVGGGYRLGTDSYLAQVYAFHRDLDDQTRLNADSAINLERDAVEFVTRMLMLKMEIEWRDAFFGPSIWAHDLEGVAGSPTTDQFVQWDDYTDSDPVADIEAARVRIMSTTGYMPNTLILGYEVWSKLQHHPDIRDRYKYTTAESITPELVARVLGVERILIATGIIATNPLEAPANDESYEFLYGKSALLVYSPGPTASLMAPSSGVNFLWRGISGSLGQPVSFTRFRMEHLKSERFEGEIAFDFKVTGPDLGVFFEDAVS